jgi:hypothetical protein
LNQKVEAKDAQIAALKTEKDAQIGELQTCLAALEQTQHSATTAGVPMQFLMMAIAFSSLSTMLIGVGVALIVVMVRRRLTSMPTSA